MNSEDKYYLINGTLIHADQLDELYHYGRPGMEWGKHLPGTDWWKQKVGGIKSHFKSEYNSRGGNSTYQIGPSSYGSHYGTSSAGKRTKTRAAVGAAVSTAKYIGRGLVKYGKKLPGHMVNEAKNIGKNLKLDAKESFQKRRKEVLSYFEKYYESTNGRSNTQKLNSGTHLDAILKKEENEALSAWSKAAMKGGLGNTLNHLLQTTQYRVASAVNSYLKSKNMDKKVDKFLSKFMGKSSAQRTQDVGTSRATSRRSNMAIEEGKRPAAKTMRFNPGNRTPKTELEVHGQPIKKMKKNKS